MSRAHPHPALSHPMGGGIGSAALSIGPVVFGRVRHISLSRRTGEGRGENGINERVIIEKMRRHASGSRRMDVFYTVRIAFDTLVFGFRRLFGVYCCP